MDRPLTHRLLAGAAPGANPAHAAVLLVTNIDDSRLAPHLALAWDTGLAAAIDWPATRHQLDQHTTPDTLSDHDRALIALADSLATGHPVNLRDTLNLTGPTHGRHILRATSMALGIRTHRSGTR